LGGKKLLRLMWLSDRMIGGQSAYSKVTNETCTELAKAGHAVAHTPMGHANRMGKNQFQGVLVYPSGDHRFSEDVIIPNSIDWKSDLLITLKEVWNFENFYKYAVHWAPMIPIDHSPVSTLITSKLSSAIKPIAISRHAQRELKSKNIESTYIPHALYTDRYRPLEGHKKDCKKMFYLDPDEFTVGIVAMNRARKLIPNMLLGYKRFLEINKDVKSRLMLWSNILPSMTPEDTPMGIADVGVSLIPEIMELGLGEAIRWPDQQLIKDGLPEWSGENYKGGWDMVKLYNSFDVLLLCTGGEGFGLPLIEAQASGVPVITTDYAAGPEQVGSGLTVKPESYVILNTPGTRYAVASVDGMAEALTKIMNGDPEKQKARAVKFAERYSWPNVMEKYWKPFLHEVEEELKPLVTKKGIRSWS